MADGFHWSALNLYQDMIRSKMQDLGRAVVMPYRYALPSVEFVRRPKISREILVGAAVLV